MWCINFSSPVSLDFCQKKNTIYTYARTYFYRIQYYYTSSHSCLLFFQSFPDSSIRKEKFALLSVRFNQNWKLLPDIKLTEYVQLAIEMHFPIISTDIVRYTSFNSSFSANYLPQCRVGGYNKSLSIFFSIAIFGWTEFFFSHIHKQWSVNSLGI